MADANIELFAKFEVNQSNASADLFAKLRIYPIWSGTPAVLFAKFFRGADGSADLYAQFNVVASEDLFAKFTIRHTATANLFNKFRVYIHFAEKWGDKKAVFRVARPGDEDLSAEVTIRHSAATNLKAIFTVRQETFTDLFAKAIIRHSAFEELFSDLIVRNIGSADLKGITSIRHSASTNLFAEMEIIPAINLKGVVIIRHSSTKDLHCDLSVRHPYWLWTTRRYINGVIDAAESLIGDAKLEYVIEGVMEDIQGYLEAYSITEYENWTNITLVTVLIRRAATYGVVAALYARHSKTFRSRVIPTVAPVTVTTIGDEERAMNYWQGKMDNALANYFSTQNVPIVWVSTADEEPYFTMEDIPISEWNPDDDLLEWHNWLNQRSY